MLIAMSLILNIRGANLGVAAAETDETTAKTVCLTGYIMDTFCIERETLLDNPSVATLEGPDVHTIHCLVDVARCYESGFEILVAPEPGGDGVTHVRAFKLDETGRKAALKLARETGSKDLGCFTCTGNKETSQRTGFRATVTGTFDINDSSQPKILKALSVESADTPCNSTVESFDYKYGSTDAGGKTNLNLVLALILILLIYYNTNNLN